MADTIGYTCNNQIQGKYSDIVTNSFYASHIINGAGTGGIVCFNDNKLYKKAKLLRDGAGLQHYLMSLRR